MKLLHHDAGKSGYLCNLAMTKQNTPSDRNTLASAETKYANNP